MMEHRHAWKSLGKFEINFNYVIAVESNFYIALLVKILSAVKPLSYFVFEFCFLFFILTNEGTCVDKIIALYHASLFAGHQGVVKMYLTMKDKFFIPGLMHYLRSFIKGCHIWQLARPDKPPMRQLQPQIYLNYRPLSK